MAVVICPNGHKIEMMRLVSIAKSEKSGDSGRVQCPICKHQWCYCPQHGAYPCPPPCPYKH